MSGIVVKKPGSLALPASKGNGLALINYTLSEFAAPLEVSDGFRHEWHRTSGHSIGTDCLGGKVSIEQALRFIDEAKRIHRRWLRHYAEIRATYDVLFGVLVMPERRLDHPTAVRMLSVLFGALGKRKTDDENAMLLLACADMFSSIDESIGAAVGLWKPIDRHPLIFSIAIKQLIATAVFTSAAELREAMAKVRQRLENHASAMRYLVDTIERADAIVFAGDRAAWDAAYAGIDGEVVAEMQQWGCVDEEGGEDDDGHVLPPSARWVALADLIEAKRAAEQTTLEQPRRAACATKAAGSRRSR